MVGQRELEFGTQAINTAIIPRKIVRDFAKIEAMDMKVRTQI